MKLFSEVKPEKESDGQSGIGDVKGLYKTVIISPRKQVINDIASVLLMFDIGDFQEIQQNFFQLQNRKQIQDADAIIIDIIKVNDLDLIKEKLTLLVSVNCRCVLVGDTDSIAFSKEVAKLGVSYFHYETQLQEMPESLLIQHPMMARRGSVMVSVLGCKGGSGTSTIAYQLLRAAEKISNIPLLLVQGASGSADLDLLLGSPLPKDGAVHGLSEKVSVKIEPRDSIWRYDDPHFSRFNMIFIDHNIHCATPERIDSVLTLSHTIVLVINRDLSSLRVAKSVLDERKRLALGTQISNRRIYLCLNDNRPVQKGMLKNDDIAEYLGIDFDLINSYDLSHASTSKNAYSESVYGFAATLLGKKAEKSYKGADRIATSLRSLLPWKKNKLEQQ